MFFVESKGRGRYIVAALRAAKKMIGTVGDPRYWPAQSLCGDSGERVFAVWK